MPKRLAILLVLVAAHAQAAGQPSPVKKGVGGVVRRLLEEPAPTPPTSVVIEAWGDAKGRPHPPEFYDADKPPPEDAVIDDIVDYWQHWSGRLGPGRPEPSEAVRLRLLAACEAEPGRLVRLIPLLPETPAAVERVKRLYDGARASGRFDEEWLEHVRRWLQFNSAYFAADLLALAREARDRGTRVEHEDALKALARFDWPSAGPLLESLAAGTQPRTAALALALLHRHAHDADDTAAAEKYRARLLAVASDRAAPGNARYAALDELMQTRWPGRDEWCLTLLEDETLLYLSDNGIGHTPLATLCENEPERWLPVMAELLRGEPGAVRNAAGQCLVSYAIEHPSREAVLPVLRWLSDPDWLGLGYSDFSSLVYLMGKIDVPESVPGLISILENPELTHAWAALALARYKDPRAVPALKNALAQERNEQYRQYIIEGLLASGGVAESEQLASLEAYAAVLSTPGGRERVERQSYDWNNPLPLAVSVGLHLARRKETPDSLARAVLVRVESLRAKRPALARALLEVAEGWQSKLVDQDVVRRIADGTADAATIKGALERRGQVRESAAAELRALAAGGGASQGVAAVLLGEEALARGVLDKGDEAARAAVLACARLTQTPLPVAEVGALLGSRSPLLRLAAERYLLADDGAEATEALWAHHAGRAFITGWRENVPFIGGSNFDAMARAEEKLRAELFGPRAPLEIYALLGNSEHPQRVLRVYADRAVYTFDYADDRTGERVLSRRELRRFKELAASSGLVEAGPHFSPCHYGCWPAEFFRVSRRGGRRVFSHGGFGGPGALLIHTFEALVRESESAAAPDSP